MALNAQSDNLYGKQEQSHVHSSFSDPNPALASNKVFKAQPKCSFNCTEKQPKNLNPINPNSHKDSARVGKERAQHVHHSFRWQKTSAKYISIL